MASIQYSVLRVVSMLGGLVLVGVAAFLNVHHAAESEGSYFSPVCIAIVALAFGSALAVPVMLTLMRTGRRGLALVALLGVAVSEIYGFQLSAERLLAARDQRAQQVKTANAPQEPARKALEDLEKDRKAECKSGLGKNCRELKVWEDKQRAALASTQAPRSHSLIADATGLPAWLVEIVPAMAFSTGLLMLGLVLVGFGGHSVTAEVPAVPEEYPDENEQVVSWIQAYHRRRHGRDPRRSPRCEEPSTASPRPLPGDGYGPRETDPGTSRFRGFSLLCSDVPQFRDGFNLERRGTSSADQVFMLPVCCCLPVVLRSDGTAVQRWGRGSDPRRFAARLSLSVEAPASRLSSGPMRTPFEPIGAIIATIGSFHQDREQRMYRYERTAPATAVCLALVVAAFGLFIANFEWPTSRMVRKGFSISENDILVYDVLPVIVAGFVIGLGAIAITRLIFPRSSIKVVLYVVGACAGLAALPLLWLSAAIGARNIRDLGAIAMLFAVPLAIATWAVISSYRTKREAR